MSGDYDAMQKLLGHYEQYMRTILSKQGRDTYGNTVILVGLNDLEELKYQFAKEILLWKPRKH